MIPRTFPSSVASNGSAQMIVYFLPSVSGLTRWVDYIPVKFTTVATAATENTYNQNGYIPVVSISSIAGATPFKEYVPVYLDSSATDAEVWKVNITGFIPVGTAGIGGAALYMDFAATTTIDPRVTFSRTTNATLTNSAGLVSYAPMNLLTFSEQFDNASWVKTNATITANAAIAPNGTLTADKFVEAVGAGSKYISTAVFSPNVYVFSIDIKYSNKQYFWASIDGSTTAVFFDVLNGTVASTGSGNTGSITPSGGGWYRCTVTKTTASSFGLYFGTSNSPSSYETTGNGVDGIYIWGAQLELGNTATTYNPTTVKNLLGYTEHFDNAAWTKSNASISATKVDDIYGQPFAQKLVESVGSALHYTSQAPTIPAAPLVISFYAKAAERTRTLVRENSISGAYSIFDLSAGTVVTNNGGMVGTITDVGGGWYRCSALRTYTVAGATQFGIFALPSTATTFADATYTGDGTSGIYIFGAQLSDSASVDPYVYNPVAAPTAQAYYGPRFDYDPVTLAPKGLLIEEQRTNLVTYSEQFENAAWLKITCNVNKTATTAPDGTLTGNSLTATGGDSAVIGAVAGQTAGNPYTFSVWLRGDVGGAVRLALLRDDYNPFAAITATYTTSWQRFTVTGTLPAGNTVVMGVIGGGASFTSGEVIYAWGAQLEAGAFATSYIPTVASQVTRAADSASIIGNNFARWYNQTEGSVYVDATPASSGYSPFVQFDDGAANNRILAEGGVDAHEYVAVGGAIQASIDLGATAANTSAKLAISYKANDFAGSLNGGAVGTDASGSIPTVTTARISANTSNSYSNTIKRIAYYNRRLSNAELQGITS